MSCDSGDVHGLILFLGISPVTGYGHDFFVVRQVAIRVKQAIRGRACT